MKNEENFLQSYTTKNKRTILNKKNARSLDPQISNAVRIRKKNNLFLFKNYIPHQLDEIHSENCDASTKTHPSFGPLIYCPMFSLFY